MSPFLQFVIHRVINVSASNKYKSNDDPDKG